VEDIKGKTEILRNHNFVQLTGGKFPLPAGPNFSNPQRRHWDCLSKKIPVLPVAAGKKVKMRRVKKYIVKNFFLHHDI